MALKTLGLNLEAESAVHSHEIQMEHECVQQMQQIKCVSALVSMGLFSVCTASAYHMYAYY